MISQTHIVASCLFILMSVCIPVHWTTQALWKSHTGLCMNQPKDWLINTTFLEISPLAAARDVAHVQKAFLLSDAHVEVEELTSDSCVHLGKASTLFLHTWYCLAATVSFLLLFHAYLVTVYESMHKDNNVLQTVIREQVHLHISPHEVSHMPWVNRNPSGYKYFLLFSLLWHHWATCQRQDKVHGIFSSSF